MLLEGGELWLRAPTPAQRENSPYSYEESPDYFTPELRAANDEEDRNFRRFIDSAGQTGLRWPTATTS